MKRAERQQLGAVIEEVRAWVNSAHDVRQFAAHLPLSGQIALPQVDVALLSTLEECAATGDLDEAGRLLAVAWFDGRRKLQSAHQAALRVAALHAAFRSESSDCRLSDIRGTLSDRDLRERDELARFLLYFDDLGVTARQMLYEASHLPITRAGALSDVEVTAAEQIIDLVDTHAARARLLLDGGACAARACLDAHNASRAMYTAGTEALQAGALQHVHDAASRISDRWSFEKARLSAILVDLDDWHSAASRATADAELLPLTHTGALTGPEQAAIHAISDIYAKYVGQAKAYHPSLCGTGSCEAVHQAIAPLAAYHLNAIEAGDGDLVVQAAERLAVRLAAERVELRNVLNDLAAWHQSARQALHDAEHMPLTRSDVLSDFERTSMETIDRLVGLHGDPARGLLNRAEGSTATHEERQLSAALLWRFHADAVEAGVGVEVVRAALRVSTQLRTEEHRLANFLAKVRGWPSTVFAIRESCARASREIPLRTRELVKASTPVKISGRSLRLLVLGDGDSHVVSCLTLLRDAALSVEDEQFLATTADTATSVMLAAQTGLSKQWKCRSDGGCQRAHEAIRAVYENAENVEKGLDRLKVGSTQFPGNIDLLLEPSLRFMDWMDRYRYPELLRRTTTDRARANLSLIVDAASTAKKREMIAHDAAVNVRTGDVASALKAMDLEVLRKASPERIRIAPLEANGLHNVWDVLQFQRSGELASLPGLGDSSALTITQATLRLFEAVREETPVRIDVKRRSSATGALLESLRSWDAARRFNPTDDEVALAHILMGVFRQKGGSTARVLAVTEDGVHEPPAALDDLLNAALDRAVTSTKDIDIWQDFLSRPSDYFGMLTELGFMTEDEKKMHGDLPEEIVEAQTSGSSAGLIVVIHAAATW